MAEAPPDRTDFRVWVQERTRYADTDRQGHVNNAVFATFLESGRVAFLYDREAPLAPPGCSFVIVRLTIAFRKELLWNETVDIGSAVQGIGRSSFTIAQAMFRGGDCVATGESVVVLVDDRTRRAVPVPEAMQARLRALSVSAG